MRNHVRVVIIIAIFGMSSCNMPTSPMTPTPLSTQVLETPTSSISTPTPISIISLQTVTDLDIPTVTPTSTPSVFLASAKDQPVNCRFGPGISYAVIGALEQGKQAEMIGRNSDSTWWFVRNPSDPSTSCWLSADFVQTVGDVQ